MAIGTAIGIGFPQAKGVSTAVAPPTPVYVVSDTFTRSDGALGNAETGQAWLTTGGTWAISNGAVTCTTNTGSYYAYLESGKSDIDIAADLIFAGNAGLVFRMVDANNMLFVRIAGAGPQLGLYKSVSGSNTSIGGYTFTPVSGTTYRVRVVASGSSIQVYLDGILVITVTDTTYQTATKVGFRSGSSVSEKFDNLVAV